MANIYYDEKNGVIIAKNVKVLPGSSDLKYKHFAGDATPTNEQGKQNFCLKITDEDAEELTKALEKVGKVVKIKKDNYHTFFKVIISSLFPPTIVKLNETKTTTPPLDSANPDIMRSLDRAIISESELAILPYYSNKYKQWTCYLQSMWFTPSVDPVQAVIDAAECEHPTDDEEAPFI